MAVPEQIPVVNYVADGVVKKFDVPFEYDQQSDLHLYVDGDEPTIDKYFFADNSFNFYIAPTNGQGVKIKRITPKERDTDYDLHTNTVRPKALNSDFDRIWLVIQEVFSDVGGLSQAVQDEIIARIQGDNDLLNQLTAEISARMLGDEAVTEELKNYVNQVVGAIINDPTFDGIDADKVNDASGETQQQVNYNGGPKWHSRVGGYLENERVALANGDIVKSTIPNNANDPNVNMTGWAPSDAVKVANQFNADDAGLRDSTLNIAELLNPAGKFIKAFTKGVYLIDEMIIPPDTIVYANGATFKRAKGTNKPLITVGLRSILIGAIVDGDEDNIGAQLWNGDQGIKLDEGALAVRCVAKNCHGHGFTLSNDAIAIACNSYNNGREGGNGVKWGNWGDGFNMTNSSRAQLLFCRAWGSYRTGIVGTTSAGAPTYEPNPLLSVGISLVGCKAWDNYYSDVNFEGCSKVQVTDLDSKSGITFRITPDMTINGFRGAIIDASDADNATINNVIIDRDNTSSAVYISGKNPKISNITVRGKSGITQSGVAVQVITPDKSGSISNIQIDRAFNAVRTNVKNFAAFEYSNITNTVFNYDGRFFINSGFISAIDGRVSQRTTSLLIPSSGSWLNGDLLINGGSSGDYAVQCVTSGQATNVAWSNGASIALNAFIYNGVNVYKATTGGVLGTTAPNHTSGTVANGTAQLEYVSARAEFKTIAYKTDPIVGVSAIVPVSITNANDTALIGKFYWVESVLTNMPLPTSGSFTKANIETYNAYRLSGNNALTQEVNYPYLNEKWVRAYDGGIGGWSLWTLVHTKNSSGTTSNRPSGNVPIGFEFFDTTLGKPVYFKSTGVWVDAVGATV